MGPFLSQRAVSLPACLHYFTLPETNSQLAPENGWLVQMNIPFWGRALKFSGAFAVSFREGNLLVAQERSLYKETLAHS